MSWIPLHNHSQYSILDSSSPVPLLAKKAAEWNIPALALTDHANLFGAVDFVKSCKQVGVKPIIGCDIYEAPASRHDKKRIPGEKAAYSLVLLAKNEQGYHNLCRLTSIGFLEGFYYFPRIDREILQEFSEGLICLSSGVNGRAASAAYDGGKEALLEHVKWYQSVFADDYYLEIQRHQMSEDLQQADGFHKETWLLQQYQEYIKKQERVNSLFIETGKELGIPLVACNDSHYIERDDWRAHEILINVQSGEPCETWEKDSQGQPKFRIPNPKRHTYPSHEMYFKSVEQMQELFADVPEALTATVEIADKCNVELDFDTKHYPVYVAPDMREKSYTKEEQEKGTADYLWSLCEEGIGKRYTPETLAKVQEVYPDKDPMDVVRKRLEHEMNVIVPKGMADYLLIVWDFIHWSKNKGIPVGPGRGSGAGSIVLYLIGITDIEPLRFNLFFERFINPERLSYPDIDVDICMDRRNEVISYTLDTYGKANVAQIITFGTMKAKMTIKDVGRVLSVPLAKVNAIAKLVPDDLNITLDKALEKDVDFLDMYNTDEEAKRIVDIGLRLEGSIRNTGIHAAGIIICGDPLTNHIPICNAKDSEMPVTQYSMKPVEAVGMLKVDFLGLKTLTSIKMCVSSIKANHNIDIDWVNLPLDDEATFQLLNQGKTLGVFQMESTGMQDLAKQLHLDKFEEIIAVLSLYRPGPMDMIPSFINRKHGRETIENDHPWMKEILEETYGIMVYQEQVMQIACKLANYSLGEGDVLRRAMGKKDMNEMAKQRDKFLQGAISNGIENSVAMGIFDKMEKFAAYGFNKSHAAAYGYLTYVTAYLKANYPREWMAALMTCDRDDLTKVAKFIGEGKAMGIPILPPDVNEAGDSFAATPQGIRFAMSGIKGVGSGIVESIVNERDKNGHFTTFYQFFERLASKKIGKKTIESLADAGCFDYCKWSRDALKQSVDSMHDTASKEYKEKASGVLSLFSLIDDGGNEGRFANAPKVDHPSTTLQILLKEKELLGFFVTGHPMNMFSDLLQRLSCVPLAKAEDMDADSVFRSAFIVDTVQVRMSSKTQKKFAIMTINDGVQRFELPVWPELYSEKSELLKENQLLYAVLQIDRRDGDLRLSCKWLDDLSRADESMIDSCDQAFDKAKLQVNRQAMQKRMAKKPQEKEEKTPESNQPKKLGLIMDVKTTRFSEIITLKKLLDSHSGATPVEIHFQNKERCVATLHIDAEKGVNIEDKFTEKLRKLASVIKLSTSS
jgi:DNA polymerase-3 subunit alpha